MARLRLLAFRLMLLRSGPRRRADTLGVGLLVSLLLPVLGFLWLSGEKTVTLLLPEGIRQIRTHAETVGELLDRSGTPLTHLHEVAPSPDAAVVDGMIISVLLEPPTLDFEMLAHVAARSAPAAPAPSPATEPASSPSPSPTPAGTPRPTASPVELSLTRDGITVEVATTKATVGDLLADLGVEIGSLDRATPGLDARLEAGMHIVVQRVTAATHARVEAIDFTTITRNSDELIEGERREIQAGVSGEREITEEVVTVDGAEESRRIVSERVVREPQPRVVEVGTKPKPKPEQPPPADIEPSHSQEGKASWYDHPDGGFTAAHRTLPFGTVVTVKNVGNGKTVRVTINDRGPFVSGRIIDLSRVAFAEIAPLSSGVVKVHIEW